MSKSNEIKSLNDFMEYNIICTTTEEVKECLLLLNKTDEQLKNIKSIERIVSYNLWDKCYSSYTAADYNNKNINFYLFKKIYKKLKKQKKGKGQEAKTIVEYLRSKPIEVRIDNRQDYDNIINYLEEQGVLWNNGKKLSESVGYNNKIIKFLTFWGNIYGKDKLETGLMWSMELDKIRENISVKELFKKFNIEYKESPDFEVAEDGRITKVNNRESKKNIYFVDNYNQEYFFSNKENVNDCIDCGLVFATEQARDKAMFKLEIETKLKNISERLNNGRKIDWKNGLQEKFHIYYNYDKKILEWYTRIFNNVQGAIFCLDQKFLEVAKQEIGEENLIKYFKE